MPNPQTASSPRAPKLPDTLRQIPLHTCIRLEESGRARTSSIDAEWETLSALPAQVQPLPRVTARPRIETLPGIGSVDLPPLEVALPNPQRSAGSRLLVSVFAATLASSLAFIGVSTWQTQQAHSSQQPNSISVALAAPASLPRSVPAQSLSLPPPAAPAPPAPATASIAEPSPTKPANPGERQPRSGSSAIRPSSKVAAPRLLATSGPRAHKVALASTDNPY